MGGTECGHKYTTKCRPRTLKGLQEDRRWRDVFLDVSQETHVPAYKLHGTVTDIHLANANSK